MEKRIKKKISAKEIAAVGIMAAEVYVASAFLQIPIPTAIGSTRLHMGNVLCLLSGMVLSPVQGGLAAGLGSMLFDLTSPAYVTSAPFTFAFKFAMAWISGRIACGSKGSVRRRYFTGAIAGALSYVVLYLAKNFIEYYFVLKMPLEGVLLAISQKGTAATVNGVAAVVIAVPLGLALRPALSRLIVDFGKEKE